MARERLQGAGHAVGAAHVQARGSLWTRRALRSQLAQDQVCIRQPPAGVHDGDLPPDTHVLRVQDGAHDGDAAGVPVVHMERRGVLHRHIQPEVRQEV